MFRDTLQQGYFSRHNDTFQDAKYFFKTHWRLEKASWRVSWNDILKWSLGEQPSWKQFFFSRRFSVQDTKSFFKTLFQDASVLKTKRWNFFEHVWMILFVRCIAYASSVVSAPMSSYLFLATCAAMSLHSSCRSAILLQRIQKLVHVPVRMTSDGPQLVLEPFLWCEHCTYGPLSWLWSGAYAVRTCPCRTRTVSWFVPWRKRMGGYIPGWGHRNNSLDICECVSVMEVEVGDDDCTFLSVRILSVRICTNICIHLGLFYNPLKTNQPYLTS